MRAEPYTVDEARHHVQRLLTALRHARRLLAGKGDVAVTAGYAEPRPLSARGRAAMELLTATLPVEIAHWRRILATAVRSQRGRRTP